MLPFPLTQPVNSCSPFCPWATGVWITVILIKVTKPSSLWLIIYYRVSSWFQTSGLIWKRHKEASLETSISMSSSAWPEKGLGVGGEREKECLSPRGVPHTRPEPNAKVGCAHRLPEYFTTIPRVWMWLQLSDIQGTTVPTGMIPEFVLLGESGIYTSSSLKSFSWRKHHGARMTEALGPSTSKPHEHQGRKASGRKTMRELFHHIWETPGTPNQGGGETSLGGREVVLHRLGGSEKGAEGRDSQVQNPATFSHMCLQQRSQSLGKGGHFTA